jgi:hypothetical protein
VAVTSVIDGNVQYAWIDYDGESQTLEIRASTRDGRPGRALLSEEVDLGEHLGQSTGFVGFTSGTGRAGGDHDILAWRFTFDGDE